jgi:hypothetical protein
MEDKMVNTDVMKTFTEYITESTEKVTKAGGYLAYELSSTSRTMLLKRFVPKYDEVICHHVTYRFPAKTGDDMPPAAHEAHVIGYEDSGDGIEALVVEVNGSTKRPDGKLFHITLSLSRSAGKKPVHSNDLVNKSFQDVTPIAIQLEPKQIR